MKQKNTEKKLRLKSDGKSIVCSMFFIELFVAIVGVVVVVIRRSLILNEFCIKIVKVCN